MTLLHIFLFLALGTPVEPAAPDVASAGGLAVQAAQLSDIELPIEIPVSAVDRMLAEGDPGGILYAESGIEIPHGTVELTIRRAVHGKLRADVTSDRELRTQTAFDFTWVEAPTRWILSRDRTHGGGCHRSGR
jgi:hypothetical protein